VIDMGLVLSQALVYGLGLSLILTILTVISGSVALDMFVDDYPADIRRQYGPMSARAARLRPFVATALFATVLGIPLLGLWVLRSQHGSIPFWAALAFSTACLLVFNLFDLIILDWLFFCTIQPRSMVLPGTEGMAGYRDYRFHFIGFLKGMIFTLAGGLLISAVWMGLQWIEHE
jgi:hypothetical protein